MKDELIIRRDNKIIKYKSNKKIVASGNGAVIYLPKELIGQLVEVKFEVQDE